MILSEYLNRFQDIWAFPVRGGSGPPMPMTYKPFKAPWHKEQEYKWFRGGDLWILPVWGGRGGQGYPEGPRHQYYLMHLDTRNNNTYDLRIRISTLLRYSGTSYIRTLQFTTILFEDRFFIHILSHLSGIPPSKSRRSVFTTKHRFTTNMTLFYQTVKYIEIPPNTIER